MNKLLVGVLSLTLISACSAPAVKDTLLIQQSAQEQAKESALSPQEVLTETRNLQISAQREDLYFYSPTYIAQAEEEIRSAESAFEDKLSAQQIITHALTGQQLLRRGLENKTTVLNQLKLSLNGLALLEKLDAPTLFEGDYTDVQDDTKDLIILIEQGNTSQALLDQNAVLSDIADIEIKVLKKTYLGQAEAALEKAMDAEAEDFAPVSIDKANLAVEKLALFIEGNRKQLQAIAHETQKTVHLAQHAEHVAIAAEPLLKLKINSAEQHVLFIEKLIARIGQALNQQSVTHLPLDNQSIALAQAAETISKQAMAIKQQGQWQAEKAELEAQVSTLQSKLRDALKQTNKTHPAAGDATQTEPVQDTSATSTASTATIPATTQDSRNTAPLETATIPATTQDSRNTAPLETATIPATTQDSRNIAPLDTATIPTTTQDTPNITPVKTVEVPATQDVVHSELAEEAVQEASVMVVETTSETPSLATPTEKTPAQTAPNSDETPTAAPLSLSPKI
ncbi:MAG: hypothetical protein RPR40_05930 [Bermanella sp.]